MKKDMNKRITVSFQVPTFLKQRIDEMAEKQGKSFSGFARNLFEFAAFTDAAFWPTITHLAEIHGISESRVVQNIILRYVAEQAALDEVYGADTPRFATEFAKTQKGETLTGAELIHRLKAEFVTAFSFVKNCAEAKK